ncbi:MAG TPA: hypothetical protein VMK53_04660, partial [Gemmatimonadales bacterium]|nr:hypothetical protein [Gemmatimonadales bacterium]
MRFPWSALTTAPLLAVLVTGPATLAGQVDPPAVQVERATHLWDAGDYPAALTILSRLLQTPQPEEILRPIALLTGEWFTTHALAEDGRNIRISGDGRFGAWEVGGGAATSLTVVSLADGAEVARIPGRALSFAPDGHAAAFVQVVETPALREARARQAMAVASRERPAVLAANQEVARQELAMSRVMILDLASGQVMPVEHPPLGQSTTAWGADSRSIWLVTREPDQPGTRITSRYLDGRTVEYG